MIPTILAFLTLGQDPFAEKPTNLVAPPTPAQATQEAATVRSYVEAVGVDRLGRSVARRSENPRPTFQPRQDRHGWRTYFFQGCRVVIDPGTGYVVGFASSVNHRPERPTQASYDDQGRVIVARAPREVSDRQAREIAARALAATGRPCSGAIVNYVSEGSPFTPAGLAVGFRLTYRGLPFSDDQHGIMYIDPGTGEIAWDLLRDVPAPPIDLTPGGSPDAAHLVALSAAARAGVAVQDFEKPYCQLVIGLLDPKPNGWTTYDFTTKDRGDAVAGRSRLVYSVRLEGVRDGAVYDAYVDAHDGRLLQVSRDMLYPLGVTGSVVKPKPFALPVNARTWRVAEGKAPWSEPVIDALTPAPSDGFVPGRRLLMTDGHLAITVSYNPATGLVGVEGPDKTYAAYRPGPALAALLKRLAKP